MLKMSYMGIDTLDNCKANDFGRRGTTIQLSNEFVRVSIPLRTYDHIIDLSIYQGLCQWQTTLGTGRMVCKIWPRLNASSLLEFQRSMLSKLIGVLGIHCTRYDENKKTLLHLPGTRPELCLRKKRCRGVYYFKEFRALSSVYLDSLNRNIWSSGWFQWFLSCLSTKIIFLSPELKVFNTISKFSFH